MDWGSFDGSVQRLDDAAAAAERVTLERLDLLRPVVRLHADSGWKVSGARTAACWLKSYAGLAGAEAERLAKMVRLAATHPDFADAVFERRITLAQAEALVQWVTEEREPAFGEMIATLVAQAGQLADPDDFATVVRHWAGLVDQELAKRSRVQPHAQYLSQGLFGGGEIHGRRVRRRSAGTVNVIIDLLTLSGRDADDLTGIDLRSDHWRVGMSAARRLLCDSGLVATLMAGRHTLIDASDRTEVFTAAQRRALGVRDRHCVFPSCDRPAHWCDAHHLHERNDGGNDAITNAALLCRYHHRLVHEHGWHLHVDRQNRWVATDPHGIEWIGRRDGKGHTHRPRHHREPAPA